MTGPDHPPAEVAGLTVAEFGDRLAERTPAPGAGGACAVSAAAAAGLVAMAARFSSRQRPDADAIAETADRLRGELVPLADADATAYGELLAALRDRRQGTPTAAASERVAAAYRAACAAPLRIATASAEIAELGARIVATGNPNLHGDAATAVRLAAATAGAAAQLVDLNVWAGRLDDEEARRVQASARESARAASRWVTSVDAEDG